MEHDKKVVIITMVVIFFVGILVICAFMKKSRLASNDLSQVVSENESESIEKPEKITDKIKPKKDKEEEQIETIEEKIETKASEYQGLLSQSVTLKKPEIKASTVEYSVEPGLTNIYNKDLYYLDEDREELLRKNLFFVTKPYGNYEFFEVYEQNRYFFESNFVTVDSLMHTYHLYFAHLLKNIEKNELSDELLDMSRELLGESYDQYKELKGTAFEEAAERNMAFFAVAIALQGGSIDSDYGVDDLVKEEIEKINAAAGIDTCAITGDEEDYTQYKPRGYYDSDDELKNYFKAMMWYGRIQFNTESEDMIKSSILMNLALENEVYDEWKDIYDITTFFAGKEDDLGFYDYYPLIEENFGEDAKAIDIANNEKAFKKFCKEVKKLRLPEINSIPIEMGENNNIQGFRLMGQRFTIDAAIMQNLIYSRVDVNESGNLRMLPDVLDVAAAFGSEKAYSLLEEQGEMSYKNYKDNLDGMKKSLSKDEAGVYLGNSLYGNWINTLRPLLNKKGKGYPSFMQSGAWENKDIETFAGSFTELKHDTVLYSKQVMAEMGGGDIPEYDDRGYVQPEPEVYARFEYLADATRIGLKERSRISSDDEKSLEKLSALADSLLVISEKELRDEVLTDEEYDLIREYGGTLEHFWYDVIKADTEDEEINTEKYQAALCVDVATDPNGQVLEMATGRPCKIYVVVNVDGKIKIATGAVYSFYQFSWPIDDRLTDTKWRQLMNFEPGEDGFYSDNEIHMDIPWWTKDYCYEYK